MASQISRKLHGAERNEDAKEHYCDRQKAPHVKPQLSWT
jgi:hypothetical protein